MKTSEYNKKIYSKLLEYIEVPEDDIDLPYSIDMDTVSDILGKIVFNAKQLQSLTDEYAAIEEGEVFYPTEIMYEYFKDLKNNIEDLLKFESIFDKIRELDIKVKDEE